MAGDGSEARGDVGAVTGDRTPSVDETHRRPEGATDAEIEASGLVGEAQEYIERARGRLYDLHQLIGRADILYQEAADQLESAGHAELAQRIRAEIVGRNVLQGRWTFQVVEEFDDGFWSATREVSKAVRDEITDGRRHIHEAEMKQANRSRGRPGHEATPDSLTP